MIRPVLALAAACLLPVLPSRAQDAQAAGSTRTTTLAALTAHPLFFHRQRARVQGEVLVEAGGQVVYLTDGARRIFLGDPGGRAVATGDRFEVTGTFWDVGRLQPDDSRLPSYDFQAIARAALSRDWPNPGEMLILLVERAQAASGAAEPSLRAIALDPAKFDGRLVTVAGRFRGANLYGDLPSVAAQGKWDFVLHAADAAVWITGLQPKGKGFNLDPRARVDTGRWLRVSGVVRQQGAIVWIEAQDIQATDAQPEAEAEPPAPPEQMSRPKPATPPVVVFSAPVQDDTDVVTTTDVRIQFSRDMDPATFTSRVTASYFGGASDGPPPPAISFAYRQTLRVLEIRFKAPLERYRTVRLELADGITAIDGLPLGPYALTFSIGGREEHD
jgi:hypothetical protein